MSIITLDLETTGLDWTKDKIILLGYRIDGGDILQCDDPKVLYGLVSTGPSERLYKTLREPESILRGHNIKFDAHFLRQAGYDIRCRLEDTRVMAYHQWPDEESHGLKELVKKKLGRIPSKLEDIVFKPLKKERIHIDDAYSDFYYTIGKEFVRKDFLTKYHREDIVNTDDLRNIMTPSDWFLEVEMPLTRMIYEMEAYGFPLDSSHLEKLKDELDASLKILSVVLGESPSFNPGSTVQVAQKLKEIGHNLEEIADKTEKGAYQIDAPLLKKLSFGGCEFSKNLLEYRRLRKNLTTYVEPFIEQARLDKRLHGSFNQAGSEDLYGDGARGTKTGRLSSSDPNLQNIPARTKAGKEIRKAFIAPEGEFLFVGDKKQIEPRFVGHYSQSPKLIKAYNEGLDTHGLFAADIFGHELDYYNEANLEKYPQRKIERFIGKTSWLATVYGCSFKKLLYICENFSDSPLVLDTKKYEYLWGWLPIKKRDALYKKYGRDIEELYAKWMFFKDVQDKFWAKNPEILNWRNAHIERTRRLGYVVTYGGRIIRIDGLDSSDYKIKADAERKTVNYLIQPSAADSMKLVMIQYYNKYVLTGKGRCFAVVHDELVGSLRNKEDLPGVKEVMEKTITLRNIPVEADIKIVSNWAQK